MRVTIASILSPILIFAAGTLAAASLTPGNIVVIYDDVLYEYTPGGGQVQSSAVQPVPSGTESARGCDVDLNGDVHVFNGTFSPVLSTWDASANSWTNHSFTGWSTSNAIGYGGTAVFGTDVFVSDIATASPGEPRGIVRFETENGFLGTRFADENYCDVTVGLDGVLYALRSNNRTVDRFNPTTLASLGSVTLGSVTDDFRGIAVDASGEFYAAAWSPDSIFHLDASGAVVKSIAAGTSDLTDIDLSTSGALVVGTRSDIVVLTTTALASVTSFSLGSNLRATYVAWVEDPVPVELQSFTIE